MSTIQLNFTLRTSSKCKQVHLVGSWDTYKSHLPLTKSGSKSGSWKGTFRFTSPTLLPGQRYWYYYIIDGYHASHDPARDYTTEPTTGRKLNILDIPMPKGSSSSSAGLPMPGAYTTSGYGGYGYGGGGGGGGYATFDPSGRSVNGRGISPSQIQHPYPSRPYETQVFRSEEMEALSRRYASQRISDRGSDTSSDAGSLSDSDGTSSMGRSSLPSLPSLSSRSSHNSSPSSVSSVGSCSCERFVKLKDGRLVRVDCGGTVCTGSAESSSSGDEKRSRKSRSSGKSRSSHGSSRKIKFRR